jgi:hypothetical protein
MDWQAVRDAFAWDGALRDIYVFNAQPSGWDILLGYLRTSEWSLDYSLGRVPTNLPESVGELFAQRQEQDPVLRICRSGITLDCHFFASSEIELDLDPREITGPDQLSCVLDLMQDVGKLFAKPVHLTPENLPDPPLFWYDPTGDKLIVSLARRAS